MVEPFASNQATPQQLQVKVFERCDDSQGSILLQELQADLAKLRLDALVLLVVQLEHFPDERIVRRVPALEPGRPSWRTVLLRTDADVVRPGEEVVDEEAHPRMRGISQSRTNC